MLGARSALGPLRARQRLLPAKHALSPPFTAISTGAGGRQIVELARRPTMLACAFALSRARIAVTIDRVAGVPCGVGGSTRDPPGVSQPR
jgi:hypothetical protein